MMTFSCRGTVTNDAWRDIVTFILFIIIVGSALFSDIQLPFPFSHCSDVMSTSATFDGDTMLLPIDGIVAVTWVFSYYLFCCWWLLLFLILDITVLLWWYSDGTRWSICLPYVTMLFCCWHSFICCLIDASHQMANLKLSLIYSVAIQCLIKLIWQMQMLAVWLFLETWRVSPLSYVEAQTQYGLWRNIRTSRSTMAEKSPCAGWEQCWLSTYRENSNAMSSKQISQKQWNIYFCVWQIFYYNINVYS